MPTVEELKIAIEEAKQRVADLTRTEYESLPAGETQAYLTELEKAEERVRELTEELKRVSG